METSVVNGRLRRPAKNPPHKCGVAGLGWTHGGFNRLPMAAAIESALGLLGGNNCQGGLTKWWILDGPIARGKNR